MVFSPPLPGELSPPLNSRSRALPPSSDHRAGAYLPLQTPNNAWLPPSDSRAGLCLLLQTLEQKCASPIRPPRAEFHLSSQTKEQGTPFPQTLVQGSAPASDSWASAVNRTQGQVGWFVPSGPVGPTLANEL